MDSEYIETAQLENIRADYLSKVIKVKELCIKYGISKAILYKLAKENNWPQRSVSRTIKKVNSTNSDVKKRKVKQNINDHKHTQPTSTLEEALEFITMDLMHRIKIRTAESSDDHDKDARTLSSLVRTYEKLKDIKQNKASPIEKDNLNNSSVKKSNQDTKRREIATSLEKLIQGL